MADLPAEAGRPYRLSAHVVCHDFKFSGRAETVLVLDGPPTAAEAAALLWPVAEALLARCDMAGGRLELIGVGAVPEPGRRCV